MDVNRVQNNQSDSQLLCSITCEGCRLLFSNDVPYSSEIPLHQNVSICLLAKRWGVFVMFS